MTTEPTSPDYPSPAQLFDLTGQVAVVTGGGRGIGEGIARTFAAAGAKIVVAARRTAEVEAVAASIVAEGGEAIGVGCDVTDDAAVDALARTAIDAFGSLTIWVNNAGGSPARKPLTELSREEWDQCTALNLTAVWVGIVTAAKYIETGSILNISSGAGTGPVPGSGHYGAAKAGVNSLTMTASAELAPRVRVNGIMPGAIPDGDLPHGARHPQRRRPGGRRAGVEHPDGPLRHAARHRHRRPVPLLPGRGMGDGRDLAHRWRCQAAVSPVSRGEPRWTSMTRAR